MINVLANRGAWYCGKDIKEVLERLSENEMHGEYN